MKKIITSFFLFCSVLLTSFAQTKKADPNFKPALSSPIPVIKITSKSGSIDFVTKPVAKLVTDARATWGDERSDPAPFYEECSVTVIDSEKNEAISNADAKVKVRGNWTTTYDKKPLRIRFNEEQSLLGMNSNAKNRDWVLLTSYKDWSFSRDITGLYIAKMLCPGYVSDFNLAEVYINDKYFGVYVVAELQEVAKNRINITQPAKGYKGTDIGYLIEYDYYHYAEKNNFTIKYENPVTDINGESINPPEKVGYTIKSKITNDAQKTFVSNYLSNVWKICYEVAYNNNLLEFDSTYTKLIKSKAPNAYVCISKVIDINSLITAYILSELVCDPDLYYSSFYMTADFGPKGDKKLHFEAPWDFDSTMGNKNFCADGNGLYAAVKQWDVNHQEQIYCNPWMMVFVNSDWFNKAVLDRWHAFQANKPLDKIIANIDSISTNYQANFAADQKVWKNIGKNALIGNELCKASAACKNQQKAAARLKAWLTARFAYLDKTW